MPSTTEITVSQLARRVGLPDQPMILDVRTDEDFGFDPRRLPTSRRRPFGEVAAWAPSLARRPVVVVCQKGLKLSQGVAAMLRLRGFDAETLEGGFEAWRGAGEPLVAPERETGIGEEATLWVTRARPKVDRIACPWLIRRFADPDARFLFVAPSEVLAVAERFGAIPFDVEATRWSHRGELCSFDVLLEGLGITTPALARLALIVRAADTARLDLAPQASGLLAVSLGLSRMFRDDLAQLEAGLLLYDAFFRWCRDATEETHNWPSSGKPA
jgi:rhodanese-related sulfurtransferase